MAGANTRCETGGDGSQAFVISNVRLEENFIFILIQHYVFIENIYLFSTFRLYYLNLDAQINMPHWFFHISHILTMKITLDCFIADTETLCTGLRKMSGLVKL